MKQLTCLLHKNLFKILLYIMIFTLPILSGCAKTTPTSDNTVTLGANVTAAPAATTGVTVTPQAQQSPSTSETPTPTPATATITPSRPEQVTLLAVGDNLIHEQVVASGVQPDGSLNYDHLYSRVKSIISAADIAVVNQETILGGPDFPYTGYPEFNSPTQIGDALINAGFDVVLEATNHTLDKGVKGVENAMDYWAEHPGIVTLGVNRTIKDSERIPVIEKNGIRIAMLNYTYGLNGHPLPKNQPYLVNMLDQKKIEKDIEKAKEISDFIIIFPHWGTEYSYDLDKRQEALTDFFYDQGVDLVIGTHPHVLEPVEWIQKDGGHRMLVYYSLGNFMSYQKEAPRMLGGMANITITREADGVAISDASITPIITHYENGPADYHYGIYELKDYNEELAKKHGVSEIAQDGPMSYENMCNIAKQVLGSWYNSN